ncbi:MAG: hypothetical protein ROW39_11690 [Anaerolineaceae bacterium]
MYYHFNLLERHGLIEVVETRMVANMAEKHFRATFTEIDIDPGLLSTTTEEGKEMVNTLIASTIDATREDLLRSLQARYFQLEQGAPADPRQVILKRTITHIADTHVAEYIERIDQLISDFSTADGEPSEAETRPYALVVAFYPSFYFLENHAEQETLDGKD